MTTEKLKKKRSPRKRRWLRLVLLIAFFLFLGVLIFPSAESALIEWLEDDPFTPMCHADHLEVALLSNFEGEVNLYRKRLNGESPRRVTDVSDAFGSTFQWTPDGSYLVLDSPRISSKQLFFLESDADKINPIDLPDETSLWYLMPDSSAVIVRILGDSYGSWERFFQISLPITNTSVAEEIYSRAYGVWQIDRGMNKIDMNNVMLEQFDLSVDGKASQVLYSSDRSIVALGYPRQQIGVNKRQRIVVRDTIIHETLWEMSDERTDYDVQHVIQDISPSNDLLYFNEHYPIGEQEIAPELPDQAFIAHIDEQYLEPILEDFSMTKIFKLDWSPDGRKLFIVVVSREKSMIENYIADYDGKNRTLVSSTSFSMNVTGQYNLFNWTPDGQYLSYVDTNDWIYLLDLELRNKCRVAKGNSGWYTSYDWRIVPEREP